MAKGKELERPDIFAGTIAVTQDAPFSLVLNRPEQMLQQQFRGNLKLDAQNVSLTALDRKQGSQLAIVGELLGTQQSTHDLLTKQGQDTRNSAIDSYQAQQDFSHEMGKRLDHMGGQFYEIGEKLQGIPRQIMDLREFINSEKISPEMIAVMSKKGYLINPIHWANLHNLPSWQQVAISYYLGDREGFKHYIIWHRRLIATGQVDQSGTFFDTYELDCTENEKQFLEGMRQLERSPHEVFMSYWPMLAEHGVLNRDLHYKLAQMPGGDAFRFGIEGVRLGVRDLNAGVRNVDMGIQDGNIKRELLIRRHEALEKVSREIRSFTEEGNQDRREGNVDRKQIAGGVKTLVDLGLDSKARGIIFQKMKEAQLAIEEESLEYEKGVLKATERTADNTNVLPVMSKQYTAMLKMEELSLMLGEEIRKNQNKSLQIGKQIAGDTSTMVDQNQQMIELEKVLTLFAGLADIKLGNIEESTTRTANYTGIIASQNVEANKDLKLIARNSGETVQELREIKGLAEISAFAGVALVEKADTLVEETKQGNIISVATLEELGRMGYRLDQQTDIIESLRQITIQNGISLAQLVFIANQLPEQLRTLQNLLQQIIITVEKTSDGIKQSIDRVGIDTVGAIERLGQAMERNSQNVVSTMKKLHDEQEFRDMNKLRMLANSFFESGHVASKKGSIKKAIDLFDEAEKLYEGDPRVYFQRGLCYMPQANFAQAERDLITAFKLTPEEEVEKKAFILHNLAISHYSMHIALERDGKDQEASKQLEQTIAIAQEVTKIIPKSHDAKLNLAGYLVISGRGKEAFGILVDVIQYNPKYIEKIQRSAIFAEIRPNLKNVLEAPVDSDKTTLTLALIKDILAFGDEEIAHSHFIELLQRDPANLNSIRFWEMSEFKELLPLAKDYFLEEIASPSKKGNPEYWYGISSIVLHLDSKLRTRVYKAFCNGADLDPDFEKQDVNAIKAKIRDVFGDKLEDITSILKRRVPVIFPWLINKL